MKITVGIACFKQKQWLSSCLRSLSSQKNIAKSEFEVIVVNDDPHEKLDEIITKFNTLNISLLNNHENMGLSKSLNKILNVARGRYFIRVDSDDYVSEIYLSYLATFLDNNRNYQAVACDYMKVDSRGRILNHHVSSEDEFIACGIMFTYESLLDVGMYNENFEMREGHELLKRYKQKYSVFNMPLPLYRYRIHESNRTKTNSDVIIKYDELLNLRS